MIEKAAITRDRDEQFTTRRAWQLRLAVALSVGVTVKIVVIRWLVCRNEHRHSRNK